MRKAIEILLLGILCLEVIIAACISLVAILTSLPLYFVLMVLSLPLFLFYKRFD